MIPKLTEAKHISGYRIWLNFEDGKEGEVDLEQELWGEIFEAVRDEERFREFSVDPELNTLTWPNGADFAPEYLYRQVSVSKRCSRRLTRFAACPRLSMAVWPNARTRW